MLSFLLTIELNYNYMSMNRSYLYQQKQLTRSTTSEETLVTINYIQRSVSDGWSLRNPSCLMQCRRTYFM